MAAVKDVVPDKLLETWKVTGNPLLSKLGRLILDPHTTTIREVGQPYFTLLFQLPLKKPAGKQPESKYRERQLCILVVRQPVPSS